MPDDSFTLQRGFDEAQREAVARIYWEAFGGKLGAVLGPDRRAIGFLMRVLRPDHCLCAVATGGRVIGVAGFKSPQGSFAGGTPDDMRGVYGRIGAFWRNRLLWLLSRDIDNHRFLVDGIAVTRACRGAGVGTALIDALCNEARARGYTAIRLEVIDSNWRARALYERAGFVALKTERMGPLRWIFGFAAAITMVRPLEKTG